MEILDESDILNILNDSIPTQNESSFFYSDNESSCDDTLPQQPENDGNCGATRSDNQKLGTSSDDILPQQPENDGDCGATRSDNQTLGTSSDDILPQQPENDGDCGATRSDNQTLGTSSDDILPQQPENDGDCGATRSDNQTLETSGLEILEEIHAAGSEFEYVLLSEVNNVIIEYTDMEKLEKNNEDQELIMNENEMVHEVSLNEIGGVVEHIEEVVQENVDMSEEAQEIVNEEGDSCNIEASPQQKKRTRKRLFRPETWKRNIRKKHHQAGLEYINEKGRTVPKKKLISKKDCLNKCKYKCSKNITDNERNCVFSGYYGLKSKNEKLLFITNNTERVFKNRKTTKDDEKPSRRNFTFKYYFTIKGKRVQVCQNFFLCTLQISQKSVYNVHLNKNADTGVPKPDGRGLKKNTGVPEELKNNVRDHIKSFPVVESHYCRADTNKLYLESSLNIRKMFELFKEKYPNSNVKESMYRNIFNTEFNLDFHVPKKDRCDICEEHAVALKENIDFDENKYMTHIASKNAMRAERKTDKEGNDPVLCFDLQNVISCPRAEISSFFYYSKLSVYNLTAHLKIGDVKKVYCAIWPETMGGRGGNDIASAVFKIVNMVLEDNPTIKTLTTWSDSCVPQNRNQMMSGAMIEVLKKHPTLQCIVMKYSTPGHGAVQDIDNIHSQIEKAFNTSEYYSPISLMRILLKVNRNNPFRIIQMSPQDFLDFEESSKDLEFKRIPFTKVSCLIFSQVFGEVGYTSVHGGEKMTVNIKSEYPVAIRKCLRRKKGEKRCSEDRVNQEIGYKTPKRAKKSHRLNSLKIKHLEEMVRFMPLLDREYYRAILQSNE